MSQTYQISEDAVVVTPLARQLSSGGPAPELEMRRGAQTPLRFTEPAAELRELIEGAGIFDLGYRTFLRAVGKDRVRWLNGMITQAVKSMTPGQTGYTLILNPQGRIQGDGDVYSFDDFLLIETDRSQSERLLAHLRRFIIMDDVKLEELDAATTAIGVAGPKAAAILEKLGAVLPEAGTFRTTQLGGVEVRLVSAWGPVVTRFEIHVPAGRVLEVWKALVAGGATECGGAALEKLRILEGRPLFDVDFSDKHLPQEANLERALNFTKGCYIGQEIVERIRSRATVHRSLRQFELEGETPQLGPGEKIELKAGEGAVGELTSVARIELPGLEKTLALGVARVAALENAAPDKVDREPIRYAGGTATPLVAPRFTATAGSGF